MASHGSSGQYPSFFSPIIEEFNKGINQILSDSLLDCFKKSSESQKYMFDRMKEILNESIKTGIDGVTETMEKCANVGYNPHSILDSLRSEESYYNHKGNAYTEERMMNEKNIKYQNQKIGELGDTLKHLKESEKTLKLKLETKSKGLEEMRERLAAIERELKKSQYEKREMEEVLSRKCKLLEEENTILRSKFTELNVGFEKVSQENEIRESLKHLESKYLEVKEVNKNAIRKLEETEFANEQLKLSVGSLKQEINNLNEFLKSERNSNYSLELKLIETKEKESEMRMMANDFRDKLQKNQQEFNSMVSSLKQTEEGLKTEKKKAIELERINEQLNFSMVNNERNLKDRIDVTTMKLNKVTEENERLKERLEGVTRGQKSIQEEERKAVFKLSER